MSAPLYQGTALQTQDPRAECARCGELVPARSLSRWGLCPACCGGQTAGEREQILRREALGDLDSAMRYESLALCADLEVVPFFMERARECREHAHLLLSEVAP